MTTTVEHANFIKLTYSGYDKWTATWQGWPSDGHAIVRRKIQLGSNDDHRVAAQHAAVLFAAWLETGPMGDTYACRVDTVTVGSMDSKAYAVGVQTSWHDKESAQ